MRLWSTREPIRKARQALDEELRFIDTDESSVTRSGAEGAEVIGSVGRGLRSMTSH